MLKKYNDVEDMIIFGSAVKGKKFPKDIDIALLVYAKDPNTLLKIKDKFKNEKLHFEMIQIKELLKNRLSLNLMVEGYSIKEGKYLKNLLGISPMKLFSYNLKGFERSKKSQFSAALTQTLKKINGKRIAAGGVLIPVEKSGYFNDFLDAWQIKYKTIELTVF